MRDFLKRHHIFMKLLALVGAIILWVVSIKTDNPSKTLEFPNLSVQILGRDSILNRSRLALTDVDTDTITLKVAGNFDVLGAVNADNIRVRADLSGYSAPGSYKLYYDVSLPDGVTVVERSPERISIVLEEIVEKELDVRVEYTGNLPDGVELGRVSVNPSRVRVSGASSVMDSASYALVQVDASQLKEDYNGDYEYMIMDESGTALQSQYNTRIDSTVNLDIPVYMAKTVPIEASIITSAGVPRNSVAMVFDPADVTIFGRAADVASIRSLNVGEVNVRDFVLTYDSDFDVVLPENVEFYGDPVEKVNVYVYFRDVETKKVTVSAITLENAPEDMLVTSETRSLDVTVRSSKEKLNSLSADNIRVTADLSELPPQPGTYTVPATVKIIIGGYDVCGTYSISVNVQQIEEEGSDT